MCFFAVSADLLRAGFATLHPLLGFFRTPTTTSFHCALLCMGSTYTRSVSFSIFLFTCIQLCCFFFSLYFVCYLLVIMIWPQLFDWIPFDPDLYVVDVYVIMAFESRKKNGPNFCVVDERVFWLNCRGDE
jgi:CHASE2 domain-containing sensor protein